MAAVEEAPSFQSYFGPILQLERQIAHLTDVHWRLTSLASLFDAEDEIAQQHLLHAATSVQKSLIYLHNVKWLRFMQLRASLQNHVHRHQSAWPSMDISDNMNG